MVVGADGKVAQKPITTDRLDGSNWIVTGGIADGDQIVVSGLQKVKPGAPAKATPWQPAPAQPASAAPAAH
jgi:membrane fusion protein (multidrug efflux system)